MPCLPSSSADRVSIPEDEGVDPLVAMPAPVRRLSQLLPLPAARHLLLEANDTVYYHLFRFRELWKVDCLLINSFLLHDLAELDGVSGEELVAVLYFLRLELPLETLHHG